MQHPAVIGVVEIAVFRMACKFLERKEVLEGEEVVGCGTFEPESVDKHSLFQLVQ